MYALPRPRPGLGLIRVQQYTIRDVYSINTNLHDEKRQNIHQLKSAMLFHKRHYAKLE